MALFSNKSARRPLGNNPFPAAHSGHLIFEEASWEAEQEIAKAERKLADVCATLSDAKDQIGPLLQFRLARIDLIASRALRMVVNEATARAHEDFVNDFLSYELQDIVTKLATKTPDYPFGLLPYFNPEALKSALIQKSQKQRERAAACVLQNLRRMEIVHEHGAAIPPKRKKGRPRRSDLETADVQIIANNLRMINSGPRRYKYEELAEKLRSSVDTVAGHFQGKNGQWDQIADYARIFRASVSEILRGTQSLRSEQLLRSSEKSSEIQN